MINKFFEFLHIHNIYFEEVYKYYLNHSCNFDYYNEDYFRGLISCNFNMDKNGILKEIITFVPRQVDDITTLINIHEYVHTLCAYDSLNKKFILKDDCEILSIFYEKLFVLEQNNPKLNEFERMLNAAALESDNIKYIKATKIANKLLDSYDHDTFKTLKNKIKKLDKKYY